jgi:hypothetical protein
MALSESPRRQAPQSPLDMTSAPRRTALPSRPMSSRDASDISQRSQHEPSLQEHREVGPDAGASPTSASASAVSPAPPSPSQSKASPSPSTQSKSQAGLNQGYTGQICRSVPDRHSDIDFPLGSQPTATAGQHEPLSGGDPLKARPYVMPAGSI